MKESEEKKGGAGGEVDIGTVGNKTEEKSKKWPFRKKRIVFPGLVKEWDEAMEWKQNL